MDDDLMSLRGSSRRSSGDDDLFGSFTDPNDLGFDFDAPTGGSADADEYDFGDPFNLPDFDQPSTISPTKTPQPAAPRSAPTPAKSQNVKKRKKRARRRSQTGAFGMTAPQRMVLSIFLFLDVAVLGVLILIAMGAIDPLLFQ